MSRSRFRVNPHSTFVWMSGNFLLETGAKSEVYMTATGLEPTTSEFVNEHQLFGQTWLNGWVLVYELSGCGFESSCSHLSSFFAELTCYSSVFFVQTGVFIVQSKRLLWCLYLLESTCCVPTLRKVFDFWESINTLNTSSKGFPCNNFTKTYVWRHYFQ